MLYSKNSQLFLSVACAGVGEDGSAQGHGERLRDGACDVHQLGARLAYRRPSTTEEEGEGPA
eukprot:803121-Pleurochrysis_carterae.AAC.1